MIVILLLLRLMFALMVLIASVILLSVYFIEHVLEYPPCVLCLWQRLPWFFAIILALLGWRFCKRGMPTAATITAGFLVLVTLLSFVLAGYHLGVEWAWWASPDACMGFEANTSFDELKQSLLTQPPVHCDVAEFTILGQSLAFWNMLVSLAIMFCLLLGMLLALQHRKDTDI